MHDESKFTTPTILVLGMHRSGTSAMTHVIEMLGASAGPAAELLPPDPTDNPTGYWELAELNAAHDEFLESNGFAWNRLADFDVARADPATVEAFIQRMRKLLANISAKAATLVLKDPRMLLVLSLWRRILAAPVYVMAVRDPREIATSMNTGPRGVYTAHYLLALWEKYMCSALEELRGERVLFVSFDKLLADPEKQTLRLHNALNALGVTNLHPADVGQLCDFISPQLNRSTANTHAELSASQQTLFTWLKAQTAAPGSREVSQPPVASAVNTILLEYREMLAAHAHGSREKAMEEVAAHYSQAITAAAVERSALLDSAAEQRENARKESETQLLAERQRIEFAHAEISRLHASLAVQKSSNEQVHKVAERVASNLARVERERDALIAARDDLIAARDALLRSDRDLRAKHASETQRMSSLQSDVEALRATASARIDHLSRLQTHATALEKGLRDMRSSLSWRLTSPLRVFGRAVPAPSNWNIEQRLYRAYYALPGISAARKRRFVLWIHRNIPWISRNTLSYRLDRKTQELAALRAASGATERTRRMDKAGADALISTFATAPLLSIVMPVYNVQARWLSAAIASVRGQFYPHWELCIADDASTLSETRKCLREIEDSSDSRIKIVRLQRNAGIAGASNAALKLAKGDYIGLLDNDDELTRDALVEVARCIVEQAPDLLYSDEDKLDERNAHVEAHYKPDYSPDYFFSINYLCHFSVIRRELLERIGGFREGFDGAQDYDLLLRASETTTKIAHIPKVLYHWRKVEGSTATTSAAKPGTSDAGRRALAESMQRRGVAGSVEPGPFPNTFRVRRTIIGEPLVSIIIPFRDKAELLETCVASVLAKTRYRNFEVLCIDNGSSEDATLALIKSLCVRDPRVRALDYHAPFNYSAINNFAAGEARGEHLVFLNNDTEVISEEWLDAMLEQSQRPEVGVVGARLWYADGTIQHAGVIVGPGGVAGHGHLFTPGDDPGYFARVRLLQNLSAVTFACAMTRREVFHRLGGLNADELTIAFNDVDYCLRAREAGLLVVYTPYALLYHYESKSRGYEDTPEKQTRFAAEILYMQKRHRHLLSMGDPYYNTNLSLSNSFQPDPFYVDELPK